ncbi:MAG: tetratricopeptide repeat protein [Planctomycetia bacterium]|nr:MAG: tetratricopeptide repeat protein [Planctomycetia bacterium]
MRKRFGSCIAAGVSAALLSGACTQSTVTSGGPGDLPSAPRSTRAPEINATTYFAHGHLLERQGNLDKAIGQYEEALRVSPNFVTAINRLGVTLNKVGRHADATARFQRAIALSPSTAHLFNNLGFSLYLEGRLDEAEAALHRALEIRPDFTRASMNLGLVLGGLGRFDEALAAFRMGSDEAGALYNLALTQSEAGRYTLAVQSLSAALQINPRLEAARVHLQEIAETAAAQEAAEQLAREQREFHAAIGAMSDSELTSLLGESTVQLAATPATPITSAPIDAPTWIEAIPEIDDADTADEADIIDQQRRNAPPSTEADFFAESDARTIGTASPATTPVIEVIRRIETLLDQGVRGIRAWSDVYCEIGQLLDASAQEAARSQAPAPKVRTANDLEWLDEELLAPFEIK